MPKTKKVPKLVKNRKVQLISLLTVLAVVIIAGAVLLGLSHASPPGATAVAANGNITGAATVASNTVGTNGQGIGPYVEFNTSTTPPPPTSAEHIISTLYAYPTESSWNQVESSAPTVKYAIADVCAPDGTGSGCDGQPADAVNSAWVPTFTALKTAGITPLYYISTNYGAIAINTLEEEIQNAITWYGSPSPMFDTTSTGATCTNGGDSMPCATYYGDLYTYAVNAGASAVVYNPGTIPPSNYMFGNKEIIQVFEGTAANFEGSSFPSWMTNYPASEFAATLSVGSSSSVGGDISDAVKDHIGNFYEDDESEPPNYSTLPAFWTTEVSDVANAQ